MANNFINMAFMYNPMLSLNNIYADVIYELKAGKSGACVYELSGNRILKVYPPRNHNGAFKTGDNQTKQKKYLRHCRYESSMTYIRSIRDIVMTMILPDNMSPKVYDYGFTACKEGIQPFIVMEKVNGIELFHYQPTGTDRDVRILLNIMVAFDKFNNTIKDVYSQTHSDIIEPCHKDLHPHNIFVNTETNEIKIIDFDLSICPYDILRTNNFTSRKSLHNPFVNKILSNNIQATNQYTHYDVFKNVPKYIHDDADLYQVYSVFHYFFLHNKRLDLLLTELKQVKTKEAFVQTSLKVLKSLMNHRKLRF